MRLGVEVRGGLPVVPYQVVPAWACEVSPPVDPETDASDERNSGGPAGLIYGYIFAWAGMTCVYITLGELASMIPTSGGQYHWVSIFAPEKSKTFLSYVCGKPK